MIEAKPVIPDQYWILRQHDRKVGNIEVTEGGYCVNINGLTTVVENLNMITERVPINFRNFAFTKPVTKSVDGVHGYPTSGPAYNAIFDVKHQLPLWTSKPRSRCWQAAGWYKIKLHRTWKVMFCPKLIVLQRYQYQGPFHDRNEAITT
jgi:hypothetical protein